MGIFSFVKPGKKIFDTITSVKPNVPTNKKQILQRDLKLAKQKRIASESKLDNTIFRIEQQKERLLGKQYKKGKELEKKAKGGRVGLKLGSRKSNLQKIQEVFGPKQVKKKDKVKRMMAKKGSPNPKKKNKFPDLTGDGKVTFADILKGRGVINGKKKKNKKKFI